MTDCESFPSEERFKFCPACGTPASSSGRFCSSCGGSLIKTTENGGSIDTHDTDLPPAIQTAVPGDTPIGTMSKKWLVIIAVAAAAVLIAVLVTVNAVSKSNTNSAYQAGYNFATGGGAVISFGLMDEVGLHGAAGAACNGASGSANKSQQWINGCIAGLIHDYKPSSANTSNSGNSGSIGSTGNTGNTTTTTRPTTTTTTVPLTSAQQAFANAVINQLPLYVNSTSPPLVAGAIANVGSEICTAFSIGASQYVSGGGGPPQDADSFVYQAMLPELANGAIEGGSGSVAVPRISGGGTDTLINLAIQNLCSQYSDGIPSG